MAVNGVNCESLHLKFELMCLDYKDLGLFAMFILLKFQVLWTQQPMHD